MKIKIKLLFLALLFSAASFAQNVRGFYVNGFNSILGNTSSENTLLNYTQANGFNYLCLYDMSSLNLTSVTVKNQLASFISRAKTQYGVLQVGVAGEVYSFFSAYIIPYNQSRALATEKIDVLNFEFEFWISSTITSQYCSQYLTPGGYSCDSAGAFAYAKTQFTQIDNAAAANGLISEVYFGWPNKGQLQWFAQRADRILMHAYRTSDADVYAYTKTRLADAASINSSVNIIVIFSSEPSFMGPWLKSHSITQPYATYAAGLSAETGTWKNYINLQGFQWFDYGYMPVSTTVNATVTANGPVTFCLGGSVVMVANSGIGLTYQWTKNAVTINGATGISYTATASGSYAVKVTNSGITATSSPITVTVSPVIPTPLISASGPLSFCPGGSVMLSSSSATGNLWSTNATTQSILVQTTGNYTVTTTSGNCAATSSATTVSTSAAPVTPTITVTGSTSICPGTGISLASSATSSGGYVWSTGATTRTIIVQTAGTFWVRTGTTTCNASSANTITTMRSTPAVPVITANGSTNIGTNGVVTLSSSSASAYLWTNGSTAKSITVNTAGNYRVTVTRHSGCTATSANAVVTSSTCSPPPVPTITSSSTTNILPFGNTITLTSSAAGGYLWSTGETSQAITVSSAGAFTARTYNAGNCFSTSLPVNIYMIYNSREAAGTGVISYPASLVLFPNPAKEKFSASFNTKNGQPVMLGIYDLSGRLLTENLFATTEGNNLVEINSASLAPGMYMVRLTGENISEQKRLMIAQ